jgi:hypothetical protein
MSIRAVLALPALAVLLVACSGASEPAGPEPLSGMQEYTSAEEISTDLADRGHECRYEKRQGSKFATSSGSCWIDEHELVLSVYTTQDLAEESLSVHQLFEDAGIDYGIIVGNRWTVNCGSRDQCLPLQDVLGGRLEAPLNIG